MTDQEELAFEQDLRYALMRDRDHQFAFDGKLRMYSSRYGCTLEAVSVFLDPVKQDIVFVGAFLSGTPQFDYSKGYPQIQSEIALPFRECYEDMRRSEAHNETYLISKTRKAVLDKCVQYPLASLKSHNADRDGVLLLGDFSGKEFRVKSGAVAVGGVSSEGGKVEITDSRGVPIRLSDISLGDLSRLGERMNGVRDLIQKARREFLQERGKVVTENGTVSDWDLRVGSEKGLGKLCEDGYPLRVCYAVAKTYSPDLASLFDEKSVSRRKVDEMMRLFRKEGRLVDVVHGKNSSTFKL